MAVDLDFSGVSAAGTPLPEGEYVFMIESYDESPSKAGDSTNIKLALTVQEGPSMDLIGRTQRENINVQQSTLPFVKAFCLALTGMSDEDLADFQLSADIVGNTIGGHIKHKQDGDRVYANVVSWFTA